MEDLPDDASVIAASCSEPRHFTVIFERHFPAIHRFLHRRVGRELADDLAATTFTVAFANRARYRTDHSDARPWLYGIAANLLRRHRRTEERRLRAYARSQYASGADPDFDLIDDRIVARAAAPRIARLLADLKPADRDVLLLFAWADLGYAEIADALGIPTGTVRSRLNRARRKMREQLGAIGQFPNEVIVSPPSLGESTDA